jgi:pimeloyl-ACP methyl ester carboxylesterase
MRHKRFRGGSIALAMTVLAPILIVLAQGPSRGAEDVVVQDVAFVVRNTNRSLLPCPTDGQTHTIRGSLVAPASAFSAQAPAVTLLLHGGTGGEWHLRLPASGYDFAAGVAQRGHASVVIDRLGYDRSRTEAAPLGFLSCVGGEADIASQIVAALRSGTYTADGAPGIPFARVVVGGHSQGGLITMVEAYSFNDADAYIPMAWAGVRPGKGLALESYIAMQCASGGRTAEFDGSGPRGYASPWRTAEDEWKDVFYRPDPAFLALIKKLWNRDACGVHMSTAIDTVTGALLSARVSKPVLLVYGEFDRIFDPSTYPQYADRFTGSDDVTLEIVRDAGHGFFAENLQKAAESQNLVSAWLAARGF